MNFIRSVTFVLLLTTGVLTAQTVTNTAGLANAITAANAESQKDMLTPGQLALFKAYPTYKMVIYPTRRSASACSPSCWPRNINHGSDGDVPRPLPSLWNQQQP